MSIYKNRPVMAPATELRRYLTLDALLHTLQNQQLRLTRLDTFPDPFEGSVPKQQIDDQLPLFSSRNRFFQGGMNPGANPTRLDPWTEMTLWRRAKTRSAHATCARVASSNASRLNALTCLGSSCPIGGAGRF